jgi:hypothetical protein
LAWAKSGKPVHAPEHSQAAPPLGRSPPDQRGAFDMFSGELANTKLDVSLQSNVIAGLVAGVIWMIISAVTGASVGTVIIGGVILGVIVFIVSFLI